MSTTLNPSIALSGQVPQIQGPLDQYKEGLSVQTMLNQQALQKQQQQANVTSQQQEQIKLQQLQKQQQDSQTLSKLSGDFVQRDSSGNPTGGYDYKGLFDKAATSGVSIPTITALRNQYAESVKTMAGADEATRNNEIGKNKLMYETLEGIRGIQDPVQRNTAYQKGINKLALGGVDVSSLNPSKVPTDDDLKALEAPLGMTGQVLSDAKTQAETQEAAGKGAEALADAGLKQAKLKLIQGAKPGDLNSTIDQIVAPTNPLNARYKVLVSSAMQTGGPEAAQGVLDKLAQDIGSREKEGYIQNREDYRQTLNRQANQSNQLQKNGLEQLDKMFTDPQHGYTQFLSQADATKSAIAQAKDGSELASSLVPLMTVLGVNSFAGVHRVSPSEVQATGPQVGSLYRQLNTILDKAGSGSMNPDTIAETGKIIDGLIQAKHESLVNGAQLVTKNAGLDPTKTTVMSRDGKIDTLDNVVKQPAGNSAPAASAVPANVAKALTNVGPGIHKLSDGSSWMKAADGSITKQ